MVNIIVSKDSLKQIVEMGIKFSIAGDKIKKETPKEWNDYLHKTFLRWNNQKKIGTKKGLPKTRKLLPTHTEAWNKVYRDLCNHNGENQVNDVLNLVKLGVSNYIIDIKKREEGGYGDHRFTLYEFIKQKNGLRRFVAM